MKTRSARPGRWTADDAGDLTGRTAVVTGGSAGIGREIARVLAGHGALVVLACRDVGKAERAAGQIRAGNPAPGSRSSAWTWPARPRSGPRPRRSAPGTRGWTC